MVEFFRARAIKATRKSHTCECCEQRIDAGSPAIYWAGKVEGEFYTSHNHVDCREAEAAWNDEAGYCWDEGTPLWLLADDWANLDAPNYLPKIAERWPAVHARLLARKAGKA